MNMKCIAKYLILLITVVSVLTCHYVPVFADETADERYVICSDLSAINDDSYIISGDGSFENPYVIDRNLNPELAAVLDSYAIQHIDSKVADLSKGTTISCFENTILTQYFDSSNNGGVWVYTSGGGNGATNGQIVMKHIEYIGYNYSHDLAYQINTANNQSSIINLAITILGYSVNGALAYLNSVGYTGNLAKGIVSLSGISSLVNGFSTSSTISAFSSSYNSQVVIDADYDYKGFIIYEYVTSYNGSWYYASNYEEWYNYPYIYKPATAYGTGTTIKR